MKKLTAERARELLDYDPDTGEFIRLVHLSNFRTESAGYIRPKGYRRLCVDGEYHEAHRLAWLIVYGEYPNQIDHINGNRTDNRLVNLRNVGNEENARNRKLMKSNSSGCPGVHSNGRGSWVARVGIGSGKRLHLGTFKSLAFAKSVRRSVERQLGYHENHGRRNKTTQEN